MHRQHWVRQIGWFFELEGEIGFSQQRGDFFHAVKRFDATLCLLGFAGLGLEAVNKLLQVGNFVLLLGESRLLQSQLLRAKVFKRAVVAAVARQLGVFNVNCDGGHSVQKLTVVANYQHGAGVAFQPSLQPNQCIQVQVVGGLVKQQQIRRAHQRTCQLQAHTPSA